MPPSPSLRRSPGGDSRGDSHKRGRSLESGLSFKGPSLGSGLSFKQRDDDLTLFNELENKETESFLLQSNDDFEDILSSRANSFPEVKLGINIPGRGESSDLLTGDDDKNDYEWLLTPPETPLFPSLDDDPAPANLEHVRGRSRPVSISRSSTMERSQRSSRGSPSPQRLSPSPRSGSSSFRGRPSSAPHPSPVPLRPTTPSRRTSPPPVKPSTPPPRSSTPTSRKSTAGTSGSVAASGKSGTSPVRVNRGNSPSPKIMAWQSNIPGFSLEAPPNLRTSLADRPASYVRGSSPASRSSRGRQSMSPTATRSISSSHSQERDRLSSHSKGSMPSSGDDDADSLQSTPMGVTERPMSRKGVSGFSSSRPSAYSKKPTKTMSPSSAPKRSFDSAIRQMDRKSPQNMFRPLLSSVPSSTFYAGKVNSTHHSLVSRNSSVTTSSNASSDQAMSGAHDTEDDGASEYARAPFSGFQDEVFAFEKMDAVSEGSGRRGDSALSGFSEPNEGHKVTSNNGDSKESDLHIHAMEAVVANVEDDFMKNDGHENVLLCSRCGGDYHPNELADCEDNICPECLLKEALLRNPSSLVRLETTQNASAHLLNAPEESHVTHSRLDPGNVDSMDVSPVAVHDENKLKDEGQVSRLRRSLDSSLSRSVDEENMQMVPEQQIAKELVTVDDQSHLAESLHEMQKCCDKTTRNVNTVEGAGISVLLLNRSSSLKGPLIHGRTIHSSGTISYDDLSYSRDLTSSMRSSFGHGSISTTSSADLTSTRYGDKVVQRQFSGKRSDASSKHMSTGSSTSGTSLPVYQGFGLSTSSRDGSCEGSVSNMRHISAGERPGSPSDQLLAVDMVELHDAVPSVSRTAISSEDNSGICTSSKEADPSLLAEHMVDSEFEAKSRGFVGIDDGRIEHDFEEGLPKCIGNIRSVEETTLIESSVAEEDIVPDDRVDQTEAAEIPVQCCTSTMSEIEINDSHPSSPKSQIDVVSREELEDPSYTTHHAEDVRDPSLNHTESNLDKIAEESTVTLEEQGGRRTRSLTLEEATDTILFCSSIVHDMAYKAASIAIEKEKENLEPLEGSRPMVTIPDRRSSDRKDHHRVTNVRTPKTPKTKKRQHAADTVEAKTPLAENEEKTNEPVVRNVGLPNNGDSTKLPTKLESKCNCTIM